MGALVSTGLVSQGTRLGVGDERNPSHRHHCRQKSEREDDADPQHYGWYDAVEAMTPLPEWMASIDQRYAALQMILMEAFDVTIKWMKENVPETQRMRSAPQSWRPSAETLALKEEQRRENAECRPSEERRKEQKREYAAACRADYRKWFEDTVTELDSSRASASSS